MELPNIFSYGHYSSKNYGASTLGFEKDGDKFYYSYKTLVAFYTHLSGIVCRQNVWGTTTGKHLNWIDSDKKSRLSGDQFAEAYSYFCPNINIKE